MARRRTRSAAQRAATRKLIAFNRARRRASNPIRRRRRVARRRNPVTKAAAYRSTAQMTGRVANPIRRRRRRRSAARYLANPRRARRRISRRRRRNPLRIPRSGNIMGMVMPAVTAATGAVLLDIIMGYAAPYIPAQLNAGILKTTTKAVGALGMAWVAGKVVSKSTAHAFGVGALTVVFYDIAKQLLAQTVPGVKMDGLGFYSPAYPAGGYMDGLGVYVGPQGTARAGLPMAGMGEYVNGMGRFDSEHAYYNY